ncbi:hypothetical protein SASPL_137912 [Salvia splendens]|uniref:Uncharacterized protein n=1 Tax=Salvia splendens TaxID=180675 RepID=A0A8X8ZDE1_SALSN|nr:hypothetical protein SASPL_137912 [Salvia splendens]
MLGETTQIAASRILRPNLLPVSTTAMIGIMRMCVGRDQEIGVCAGETLAGAFARAHMRTGRDAIAGVIMDRDGPRKLYQINTQGFDGQQRVKMEPPQAATGSGQATEVEDVCGDDASNSNTTGVLISSIALLGEKHRVEEDRVVSPANYQVSASKEIYWSCSFDVNIILSTVPLPAATLLSDVDRDFKCLLQGHTQDEWDICLTNRARFYLRPDDKNAPHIPGDGHVNPVRIGVARNKFG